MTGDKLYASFLLDKENSLEIALAAEFVNEATPVQGAITPLPGSIDFLEGVMHLRDSVIPVVNLKKRLGLDSTGYGDEAKVAVVRLYDQQLGLLVDDIRDVFRAGSGEIVPISAALQSDDRIISSLIHVEKGKRTAELLDLKRLFTRGLEEFENSIGPDSSDSMQARGQVSWTRFVVFICNGQEYGVPVEYSREITFLSEIDEMFASGIVLGALNLRGRTIPVIDSSLLLRQADSGREPVPANGEDSRVLVLSSDECSFGLIVEGVREIISVPDNEILAVPSGQDGNITGIYARNNGSNVILLHMKNLVCDQLSAIKSMSRIKNSGDQDGEERSGKNSEATHHLITENCYLVFSIDKHFAVELKDVREIIDEEGVMAVPGDTGFRAGVINLRGNVVPVISLRRFYGFDDPAESGENRRLIICSGHGHTVALEVDSVVTIYKQEQYHSTPSLNPRLADKKDTLDRLIEFNGGSRMVEHVLVVNIYNLVRNHLLLEESRPDVTDQQER